MEEATLGTSYNAVVDDYDSIMIVFYILIYIICTERGSTTEEHNGGVHSGGAQWWSTVVEHDIKKVEAQYTGRPANTAECTSSSTITTSKYFLV